MKNSEVILDLGRFDDAAFCLRSGPMQLNFVVKPIENDLQWDRTRVPRPTHIITSEGRKETAPAGYVWKFESGRRANTRGRAFFEIGSDPQFLFSAHRPVNQAWSAVRVAEAKKVFFPDGSYRGTQYIVTPLGKRVREILKAHGNF